MRRIEELKVWIDALPGRPLLLRPIAISAICAAVGLVLPAIFVAIDRATPGGWWPEWIAYVWPTDFMTGAASGIADRFFYEITLVSALINAAIYAVVGLMGSALCRLLLNGRWA